MTLLYSIMGRKYYYLIFDIILIILSYIFSYIIRFYPNLESGLNFLSIKYFLIFVPSFIISFYFFQIYRIMWTYSNISDVYKLMAANFIGFVIYISSYSLFKFEYSRMIVILSFLSVSISTIFYRIILRDYFSRKRYYETFKDNSHNKDNKGQKEKKILIIGAGEAGRIILAEYKKMGIGRQITGFVDDDKRKIGKIFNGKMIFASTGDVNAVIEKQGINEVIIAMPSADADIINIIVNTIKKENILIPIKTVPPIRELIDKDHLTVSLRNVTIADLIGREEFRIDSRVIEEKFSRKVILITGAGGSIGSEICKQLLKFKIRKIICIGRGEFSIYSLIKTLNGYLTYMDEKPELIYKIIDIKDFNLLNKTFQEHMPNVVFHAAAHKHVPLMEFNEIEAIQNNVLGTWNVLELSRKYNVDEFILISTDKAVNPANIMGATKRLGELITGYFSKYHGLKTAIVRFGNVLGSRGSVIPLFREQIESGGPVTITHPDITRFFMSIPEASLLVINAAAYSRGGDIFILDMGKQFKVIDIAVRLIELYGLRPNEDIEIVYTGLRPGEKMFEELYYNIDSLSKTENSKIFMLTSDSVYLEKDDVEKFINEEIHTIMNLNQLQIRKMIVRFIPGYTYDEITCNDIDSCSRLVN